MPWEIKYLDKWTGEKSVHHNSNNQSDATGWTKSLSEENDCKAECYQVDEEGKRTHVASFGDDKFVEKKVI